MKRTLGIIRKNIIYFFEKEIKVCVKKFGREEMKFLGHLV